MYYLCENPLKPRRASRFGRSRLARKFFPAPKSHPYAPARPLRRAHDAVRLRHLSNMINAEGENVDLYIPASAAGPTVYRGEGSRFRAGERGPPRPVRCLQRAVHHLRPLRVREVHGAYSHTHSISPGSACERLDRSAGSPARAVSLAAPEAFHPRSARVFHVRLACGF